MLAIVLGRGSADPVTAGYSRYEGRVGALAVALGVGSAIASMPAAFADTTGSAGSSASDSAVKAPVQPSVRVAQAPGVTHSGAAVAARSHGVAAAGSVSSPRASVVAWLAEYDSTDTLIRTIGVGNGPTGLAIAP